MNRDNGASDFASKSPGREAASKPLAKRFYAAVGIVAGDRPGAFAIALDGRAVKTPKKHLLCLPFKRLAEAIAAEWSAQVDRINPASMPLTRLANTAIDAVTGCEPAVIADIAAFANRDLLCYRADGPPELAELQFRSWEPVLNRAERRFGVAFVRTEGVMPVSQAPAVTDAVQQALRDCTAFQLTALHVMTTLTGSALLALAVARDDLSLAAAWEAAHVDEDWQIRHWGEDAEAGARRSARWSEMSAAATLLSLSTPQ